MIWDSRDGSPRHRLQHRGDVLDVAWSPNGSLLATASADNGGRIYRADTGALVTFLGEHSNQVVGVGFSPDGASVVTASLDGSARIWGGDDFARSARTARPLGRGARCGVHAGRGKRRHRK